MKTRLILALTAIGLSAAGTPALASASSSRTVAGTAAANYVLTVTAPRIEYRAGTLPEIGSSQGSSAAAAESAEPALSTLDDKLIAELESELDALELPLSRAWMDVSG